MGVVPSVPSAMLMALVSAVPQEGPRVPGAPIKATEVRRGAISRPSELEKFLQMNSEERFDLEQMNAVNLQGLVDEARGDRRVLREVVRTAEALLPRVRAETEDPILVGAILRNKTLDWFSRSASDPNWAESMPLRWGGIFHESRVPGGRLSRKLSTRLVTLINRCVEASGAAAFLRAGFTGLFRGSASMASILQFALGSKRPRLTQHVAQAYLDDLATRTRNGDHPLPLERLSEVGTRHGSAEVNMTLAELFRQDGVSSLTVLDSRFHPEMSALAIRVVPPKNPDDASTYDLIQSDGQRGPDSRGGEGATADADFGSPWQREDLTKKDWTEVLRAVEKRKGRLDPPPRDNPRERVSYLELRDLVISDPAARKAFLAVRWKGRPSGLGLLCQLLSAGSLAPEVDTDGDYLEAELDHLDKGRADRKAKDGQWKIGNGWTIVREVAKGNVRTYRANGKSGD